LSKILTCSHAVNYILEYEFVEYAEVAATENTNMLLMLITFTDGTPEKVMQDTAESFLRSLASYSIKHSNEFSKPPNDNYYGDLYDIQPAYIAIGQVSTPHISSYVVKSIYTGNDVIEW